MTQNYAVIGDSHECVEELRRLITRLEAEISEVQIIHVGDYLDKGGDTKAMIDYAFSRYEHGDIFVRGNHESFVYGRLKGDLHALEDPEREWALFGSQEVLLADALAREKFYEIWAHSVPYFVIPWSPGNAQVYVTHAPCHEYYLGGDDPKSIKAQRNYRTIDRTIPTVEDLNWFYEEAAVGKDLAICGHMAHSGKTLSECLYKNKLFLDTGCVYGNGLSAVHIRDGKIQEFYFEPSSVDKRNGWEMPGPLGLR